MLNAPRKAEETHHQNRSEAPTTLEQVRAHFDLDICLVVDEHRRILNAAQQAPTPFAGLLADVAPTMALLPECRDLHISHLQKSLPELESDDVTSSAFKAGGRRFFVCALGPGAHPKSATILRAVVEGIVE